MRHYCPAWLVEAKRSALVDLFPLTGTVVPMGRRAVMRLLAGVAALLCAATAASPALAHVDVNSSVPSLGEVVAVSPSEIVLELSGPPGNIDVELLHRDSRPVPLTGEGVRVEGSEVVLRPPVLDDGTYVVVWSSIGLDGHLAAGQVHFSVGAPSGPVPDLADSTGASSVVDAALRWLLYFACALLLGLGWLRWSGLAVKSVSFARRARWAALAAAAAAAASFAAVAVKILAAGSFPPWSTSTLLIVTGWLVLALASASAIVLTWRPERAASAGPGLFSSAAAFAFGINMVGHLATSNDYLLLVAAASTHLLAAGLWLGAPAAYLLTGRGVPWPLFAFRLAPVAVGAVLLVSVSGLALLSMRLGLGNVGSWWESNYGSMLALKLLMVFAVVPAALALAIVSLRARRTSDRRSAPDLGSRDSSASSQTDSSQTEAEPGSASLESEAVTGSTSEAREPSELGDTAAAPRGYRRLLVLEAVGLSAVVLAGAVLAGLPAPSSVPARTASVDVLAAPASLDECTGSGPESLLCFSRYFEAVAQDDGVPVALAELTQSWQEGGSWIQSYCHALGHKLGRLGYRLHGSIEAAFAQGSDPCDYGYLHGVIEAASADFSDRDLLAAMTTLCEGVGDTENHTYRQCLHGMGHAAARRVNNDLARAMDFCRPYLEGQEVVVGKTVEDWTPDDIRFFNCVTGVAMEWNTRPDALVARDLPVGAPGTLMAECLELDTVFHEGCLEYGTSQIGPTYEREVEARNWCDENLTDPLPCYRSIGRDVIWSESITDKQAVEICLGGKRGKYAAECITRALGSVATIALDASAIDEFCPALPSRYQYLCPVVRDAMRTQLEQTVRGQIVP